MKKLLSICVAVLVSQIPTLSLAQQDFSQVQIIPHQLTDTLYYLEGSGGNIGVSIGEDGVLIIDDQYADLSEKIVAAIAGLSNDSIQYVLNTHYHGDHTGGNENMGKAGAVIVAHENVRSQLAAGFEQPLNADQIISLPVVTFSDSIDFHLNQDKIHVFHIGPAHTNGDSFVHFLNANIIHTGDTFRTTGFPVVDANTNGSFFGIVAAYELLLEISNEDTVFLPGHGVLSKQDEIRKQLDMFYTITERIQNGIDRGLSLEQIQNTQPTEEYDADWGGGRATGPGLTETVYTELMNQ
jgi:cyclase